MSDERPLTAREEGIAMLREILRLLEADPTMTAIIDIKSESSQMDASEDVTNYVKRDTTVHLEILEDDTRPRLT
jgi:hypothetical protein